jgi:hypothetical protein
MRERTSTIDEIATLFLCDAWSLGQYHGKPSLMSLDPGEMPCLEEDSIIVFLMFHGGLGACFDVIVEQLGFEDSNPRMDRQIGS